MPLSASASPRARSAGRWAGALLAAVTLTVTQVPAQGPLVRADVTVIGDDDRDAFVGSGSLLLPDQIYTDGRRVAAECPGCRWRSVIQCEMTTAGSCRGPARLCGPDGYWLRIYLIRPDGVEVDLGAACFGTGGPATREDVEDRIREQVEVLVPRLRAWRQPEGRVLPHLPVVFGVTQSEQPVTYATTILDLPVTITARPRWVWDLSDTTITTASAGRRWPDATVGHVYRRSGHVRVGVTAVWTASYEVAGLGPLAVAESVTQTAEMSVPVGEGRAVLVR